MIANSQRLFVGPDADIVSKKAFEDMTERITRADLDASLFRVKPYDTDDYVVLVSLGPDHKRAIATDLGAIANVLENWMLEMLADRRKTHAIPGNTQVGRYSNLPGGGVRLRYRSERNN